ncbi:hypothetical protein V6N13_067852 [Hibiscus sabdariffa]|uniref:Uncharacterized protein n=1 Tax=Hibiscus sabdariffa TaxID=183260 RepID=A0ABR2DUP4_9ROSI
MGLFAKFFLASLLLILFSSNPARAAFPEGETNATAYDGTIGGSIEEQEEEWLLLGGWGMEHRLLASSPNYLSYKGLERPPVCNANIYGNCIKPIGQQPSLEHKIMESHVVVYEKWGTEIREVIKQNVKYLSIVCNSNERDDDDYDTICPRGGNVQLASLLCSSICRRRTDSPTTTTIAKFLILFVARQPPDHMALVHPFLNMRLPNVGLNV